MALKVTPRVVSPKPSFTAKIDGDALAAQITKDGILIRRNEKGSPALRVSEEEFAELFDVVKALDEQLEDKKRLDEQWDRLNPIDGADETEGNGFQDDGPTDGDAPATEDNTPAVLAEDPAGEDTVARAKALLAQSKVAG